MDEKIERLVQWSLGNRKAPYKLELYPTNRCNLSCAFCWKQAESNANYSNEISPETILRLVDESARMGTREWFLCGGGEPLLNPKATLPIMDAIKAQGMKGILNTNGYSATPEMVQHWVSIGWEDLHFSIDTCDPETHDFLRGRAGAFERADRALNEAYQRRSERKSYYPYLVMISVLTKHNYHHVLKIAEYAHSRGINKLILKEMMQHPHALYLNLNRFQYWRLRRLLIKARAFCRQHNIIFEYQEAIPRPKPFLPPLSQEKAITQQSPDHTPAECNGELPHEVFIPKLLYDFSRVSCFEFWLSCFVYPDGEAHCGVWGETENVKTKSLETIWYGNYFEHMRQELIAGHKPEICSRCGRFGSEENRSLRAAWKSAIMCALPAEHTVSSKDGEKESGSQE